MHLIRFDRGVAKSCVPWPIPLYFRLTSVMAPATVCLEMQKTDTLDRRFGGPSGVADGASPLAGPSLKPPGLTRARSLVENSKQMHLVKVQRACCPSSPRHRRNPGCTERGRSLYRDDLVAAQYCIVQNSSGVWNRHIGCAASANFARSSRRVVRTKCGLQDTVQYIAGGQQETTGNMSSHVLYKMCT